MNTDPHPFRRPTGTPGGGSRSKGSAAPHCCGLSAELNGDDEVIGVEIDGKTRAYALTALRFMQQHIINDLLGGVPVSVAYCDLTDCTHVYTSSRKSEPLDIAQGGVLKRKGMVLNIEGVYYRHGSGDPMEPGPGVPPFPYPGYPWVRATWRQWKQLHPETDVYLGGRLEH